jgi:hypothetical protein
MLMKELAPKVMDRHPALAAVGRWWVWFLVAFLASLLAAFATRSTPVWILAFILAQCAGFARVASRRTKQILKDDKDHVV